MVSSSTTYLKPAAASVLNMFHCMTSSLAFVSTMRPVRLYFSPPKRPFATCGCGAGFSMVPVTDAATSSGSGAESVGSAASSAGAAGSSSASSGSLASGVAYAASLVLVLKRCALGGRRMRRIRLKRNRGRGGYCTARSAAVFMAAAKV
jgi:hypothetical protein